MGRCGHTLMARSAAGWYSSGASRSSKSRWRRGNPVRRSVTASGSVGTKGATTVKLRPVASFPGAVSKNWPLRCDSLPRVSPLRTELGSSSVLESVAVWPMEHVWSAWCTRPRCPSSALLGKWSGGCRSSSLACVCTDGPARGGSGHSGLSWLSRGVHLWWGCLLRNGCSTLPL